MNLPEVCRERFSRRTSVGLWLQAEVIAMATDLAEFIGAAVGLNLIFGIPLLPAALITSVIAFGVLALQQRGFRHLEAVIVGFVGVIVAGFAYELLLADADWGAAGAGLVTPKFDGTNSVLLACGILGATVMPHVIYLHSALTQHRVVGRSDDERHRIFRFELVDVVLAMGIAGVVNMSMLIMAAGVFHARGMTDVADLDQVFDGLRSTVGHNAHIAFGVALLASGLSSSSIGTFAGQVVMQGFIQRSIPLFFRRTATMVPAIVIIAFGVNPSDALIGSQVVLSFGIPFALIPLLLICRDASVMGSLVNRRATTAVATLVVALIVCLNVFLLVETVR
jgi:manganese transport protein